MYKIVEREYVFDVDEIKEEGFKQEWIDEEFYGNSKCQVVIYQVSDLKEVLAVFVNHYSKAYVRQYGDEIRVNVYGLYDSEKDDFLYITNCEDKVKECIE